MTALDRVSITVELPMTIRIAEKADIPKLEWHGQYTHYRNLFRRAYREQQQGSRLILVADCNDFPVGHIFVQFKSVNVRIADGFSRAYFYSFRVMELFQGHGIGTRLIQEAESVIWDHGFKWATIAVQKTNNRAHRLYERLGYRVFADDAGRWSYTDHRGRVRHVEEPCWILEKRLEMR